MNFHNSVIQRKKCKCSLDCDKYPTLSCYGYFYAHLPEPLAKKAGTRIKVARKNKNKRVALAHKLRIAQRQVDGSQDQDIWYLLKKHEMAGTCSEPGCNVSTNKYNPEYYRWSICHVVPKKLVPSVATHPENWQELCWIHHQEFDASFERAAKMKCFPEAKRKFELFKDLIPDSELRKVNPFLLNSQPGNPAT